MQEPRCLRGAGARSWPVSPTCASVGGARAGEGLGSGLCLLRPGPSAARAFGGAGSPCRRERSFCTVPCRRQSPSNALVPGGGAAGDGRACPGCRQGPLSARARVLSRTRGGTGQGAGAFGGGLTLAAPGQTQTRQLGRRSGKGVGPATAWAVAGSGAHGVPRPPAPTEARFPLSRLSGVSARSRGESEFTPKLADGAGRGRGVWPGGGRGRRDGWPRPGCGQPGPSPRAPPPGAQQRPRSGNPGNPHSGRLHAFIYWPRWEEMRFSNGLARRKALRFVGAKGGRPPPSPSRVAK